MKTPIAPKDISTKKHFWNSFGKHETEISAKWIVRFCKTRNSWRSFTLNQLTKFYCEKLGRKESFWFNGLLHKFITVRKDKLGREWLKVSPLFIDKCYTSTMRN